MYQNHLSNRGMTKPWLALNLCPAGQPNHPHSLPQPCQIAKLARENNKLDGKPTLPGSAQAEGGEAMPTQIGQEDNLLL